MQQGVDSLADGCWYPVAHFRASLRVEVSFTAGIVVAVLGRAQSEVIRAI